MLKLAALVCLVAIGLGFDHYARLFEAGLKAIPDDAKLTPRQLVEKYNYNFEDHYATTKDGYILNVWHITKGTPSKKAVFLQHGLLATGHSFLSNYPNQTVALYLIEQGYDVWLGNSRGNTFSRNHTHISPDKDEFWAWSFDEMAQYDIEAQVQYVKKQTGAKKVPYIGHSQGTVQMFEALVRFEDSISEDVMCFGALAPVARVGNVVTSIIKTITSLHLETVLEFLGFSEILPRLWIVSDVAEYVCGNLSILCEGLTYAIFDLLPGVDDLDRTAVSYAYFPAGTSL